MTVLSLQEKQEKTKGHASLLPRNTNQALGIANFAIDFMAGAFNAEPDASVLKRTELFHTDSVICGLSALALRTRAPTVLREEALIDYAVSGEGKGSFVFGSDALVSPEKAICANSAAVREWDSNGTVFGYNGELGEGHKAGEFGHNDFYPVVISACHMRGHDGKTAVRAMLLSDEIRGRLAEVFSLKTYKIDHTVHGAISSAAVYGALMGATAEQIESAIGMTVAHYIPWRAIRAGKQLSDSKGASAAISTEVAVMSVRRAMRGFIGPKDIFRNPESIFRFFEPTASNDESPFDIALSYTGKDFAVMGMHFKLGLYEHQSAGALHGLISLLQKHPEICTSINDIKGIKIVAYEPAFGIIGDPAKRSPTTRQSADHSMVFIVSRLLLKAIGSGSEVMKAKAKEGMDALWKHLLLTPFDYSPEALADEDTKKLMNLIQFEHGGKEYDDKYPEGIPSSLVVTSKYGEFQSGFVMFPAGHARNTDNDLEGILSNKFAELGAIAVGSDKVHWMMERFSNLGEKSAQEIKELYNVPIAFQDPLEPELEEPQTKN